MRGIQDNAPAPVSLPRSLLIGVLLWLVLIPVLGEPVQADARPSASPARVIPYPRRTVTQKGTTAVPALMALPRATSNTSTTVPISISTAVQFGELVALDAATYSTNFELGRPFTVTLFWRSLDSLLPPHWVHLRLAMSDHQVIVEQTKALIEPEQEAITYAGATFSQTFTLLVNETKWDLPPPLTVEVNVISGATDQPIGWQAAGGSTLKKVAFVLATLPRETLQTMRCDNADLLNLSKALMIQAPTQGWLVQGYWFGHRGLDIANEDGQPIVAAMPGKVIMAEWSNDGFGFMVKIQHPNVKVGDVWMTVETIYAHMNLLYVVADDEVKADQMIGTVGVTGRTTGPHVHFEVRLNGQPYNPFCLLPPT